MGTPLLHLGAVITCPHGIPSLPVASNARVLVLKQPVLVVTDTFPVAGCPFQLPGPVPSPCVQIKWLVPAARVRVMGQPVLLQASPALALAATQAPQGPPVISAVQPRTLGI